MKIKQLLFATMLLGLTPAFYACSDDDDIDYTPEPEPITSAGMYIVNSGHYSSNTDGSLSFYDYEKGFITNYLFRAANNRSLGSTPQDAVVYGSKMYIAVYGSNVIEVVDKNSVKSLAQIAPAASECTEPRDIVAAEGKVFVSMYDGKVARIDTTTLTIDRVISVGPNPEEMAVSNGYLYVTNSDGLNWGSNYSNGMSVSKIKISTFTEEKKIKVGLNPTKICATTDGNLFVIAMGNYGDVPAKVQKISADDAVSDVAEATLMAVKDNTVYLINSPYGAASVSYFTVNSTNDEQNNKMVSEGVDSPCAIAVDPNTGKIFITSYEVAKYEDGTNIIMYSNRGYLNIYEPDGTLFTSGITTGIGPCAMTVMTK